MLIYLYCHALSRIAFNRKCGIDVQEIGPDDVKKLFPLCKTDDVLAGFYVADDGRVNPVDVTVALAKGARMKGVRIIEGVSVSGKTDYYVVDLFSMWFLCFSQYLR